MQPCIFIPVEVDRGDDYFRIRLTHQAGWQTIKGISRKFNGEGGTAVGSSQGNTPVGAFLFIGH